MTSNAYAFGTICVAPFPFSDLAVAKNRPLVILTDAQALGVRPEQHLCAMITSTTARWHSDIAIRDLAKTGLKVTCYIRLKLFTLDARLLVRAIGQLSPRDAKALRQRLHDFW